MSGAGAVRAGAAGPARATVRGHRPTRARSVRGAVGPARARSRGRTPTKHAARPAHYGQPRRLVRAGAGDDARLGKLAASPALCAYKRLLRRLSSRCPPPAQVDARHAAPPARPPNRPAPPRAIAPPARHLRHALARQHLDPPGATPPPAGTRDPAPGQRDHSPGKHLETTRHKAPPRAPGQRPTFVHSHAGRVILSGRYARGGGGVVRCYVPAGAGEPGPSAVALAPRGLR